MKTGANVLGLFVLGVGINLVFGRRGFMPLDHSIVFDGGWRLLSGQVPFRDFAAPSGLVPSAMQVPFFLLFGVTWFALCLHASVINGLFCAAVYVLLRICGTARLEAAFFGGLSAFFFYPPMGTPFMDQHSFFFMTLMFLAAAAGTVTSGRMEIAAWLAVPILFTLGFFSGQIPISFGALCVAGWVAGNPRRAPRWLAALAAGTMCVGVCLVLAIWLWRIDWRSALTYSVAVPLSVGGDRTARAGVVGPLRLIAATLVHLPAWARLWSLDVALAATLPLLIFHRSSARARLQLWVLVSCIFATAAFMAYTRTLLHSGVGLAMVIVAVAVTAMRDALPKSVSAATITIVAFAALRDTAVFVATVDSPRIEHVRYDPGEADRAEGHLPAGLEFMRWSRGPSPYEPDEMTALIRFLREADGNFVLIGDSSILYGLTGKPSVSPVLWLDPGLTVPPLRSPDFGRFEGELLERVRRNNVRRIVLERPSTWTRVSLDDFPRLVQLTKGGSCGERPFGGARVIELCPES
jgi:hypothetical protein